MMKRITFTLALALFLASPPPAKADFADAIQAYDGGDYATAFSESMVAAENGEVDAQYMAGFLYMRGEGVRLSLPSAYLWFSLSARQGDEYAADELNGLARRMNPAQTRRAAALLRDY